MKLTLEKLRELSHGAVRVEEKDGKISFYRFTQEQQLFYKNAGNEAIYSKTFAPAGVRLVFKTNSTSLFLKVNVPFITTRSYFSVDVYVNGDMIGNIDNYGNVDKSVDYTKKSYPIGNFEKEFKLGDGEKTVAMYLPWSVPLEIEELQLDENSYAMPIPRDKKILIFGDSITQGYDALHPSKHYSVFLADSLMADGYNKAIGGEKFVPQLADTNEAFFPDYIIVAYGTNDWASGDFESFTKNCNEFYEILSKKYPLAKIFAITPIWRKNYNEQLGRADFFSVSKYIEEVVSKYDNVFFIDGFDFVPHVQNLYGDLILHPNDEGFAHYANNLYDAIKHYIDN